MNLVELGSILEMVKGKKPVKQITEPKNGYLPYVDINAFENGTIKHYTDGAKCTPCNDGDILIVCDGSRSGLVGKAVKGYVGSTLAKISAPGLRRDYLYYFVQGKYALLNTRKKGTGTPHLNPELLKQQKLVVPDLDEQKQIVVRIEKLFSLLDAGVETLKKTKVQLLKYRRSVVKQELEREYNNGRWVNTTFGEICDCLDFKRRPVNKKTREQAIGKYPYYGANGETGRIDDYLFDEELVLICEDETFIGRVKPFSYIITGKSWVNNHAHILRGKTGILRNKYLNYLLSYYPFIPLVTGTTGRKKLTQEVLLKAPVRITDYETQSSVIEEIESRLSVCDSIEQTVDTTLQQAEAMRQSILKRAFEGKL